MRGKQVVLCGFHAMRAVLAYNDTQKTKHSGIISDFRKFYIKTGILDNEMSDIISNLFDIRTNSDYNDFFVVAKEDVTKQVAGAEKFIKEVDIFLSQK